MLWRTHWLRLAWTWGVWTLGGCGGGGEAVPALGSREVVEGEPRDLPPMESAPAEATMLVRVRLDGEPAADVLVVQPGTARSWVTETAGEVRVTLDLGVEGAIGLMASHPEARIGGDELYDSDLEAGVYEIELERFSTRDNRAYEFQHPGTEELSDSTAYCAHCHFTMNRDWLGSAHAGAAKNPVVQDLYAGAAAAWGDAASCTSAGGTWALGLLPGEGVAGERCYLGDGALQALNPDCGGPCDGRVAETGGCADCHAPGMDGELGGRDLLLATGVAYEYGVHCDVCHKVEAVDLDNPVGGVGGRLQVLRPAEPSDSPALGEWVPLTFGPYADVRNPRMGSVARDHFRDGRLCAGCHESEQSVFGPGLAPDAERWPEGRIPVQSTWSEVQLGRLGPSEGRSGVSCVDCHLPPDARVGNSADLGNILEEDPGIAAGWYRPPGEVRRHSFFGPRSAEQRMIDLAGALDLEREATEAGWRVRVTVTNVGPAHALPTGEPMRQMLVVLGASCGDDPLPATGGAVVPDFGGSLEMRAWGEDWTRWPEARVGQVLRVVRRTGEYLDYPGPLRFAREGDPGATPPLFGAADKGMPAEQFVGERVIRAIGPDGTIELDSPLPEGDVVYRGDAVGPPVEGESLRYRAGQPGFGFARVMVDAAGVRNVPHFRAVDVGSDNRLMAGMSWTSEHEFGACAAPTFQAVLVYRRGPPGLSAERGWGFVEQVIAEVSG